MQIDALKALPEFGYILRAGYAFTSSPAQVSRFSIEFTGSQQYDGIYTIYESGIIRFQPILSTEWHAKPGQRGTQCIVYDAARKITSADDWAFMLDYVVELLGKRRERLTKKAVRDAVRAAARKAQRLQATTPAPTLLPIPQQVITPPQAIPVYVLEQMPTSGLLKLTVELCGRGRASLAFALEVVAKAIRETAGELDDIAIGGTTGVFRINTEE